jgi:outer membrane protein assembly factor BamB
MGYGDEQETVFCFDASSGKVLWQHSYDSDLGDKFFEGGPTATPTVDGDAVYTLSRWGDLFCFENATGKIRWSKNVQKESGIRVPGWGFAGSPVISADLLLLNIGEGGLAIEKATGKVVWSSANKDAGYSTPVPFSRGQEPLAIFSSGKGFAAVGVKSGKETWSVSWVTQYGVNAADPILKDDYLFVCSGYGKGAALWKLGSAQPQLVWQNKQMRNQMNPSVLLDGSLFGIDGDAGSKATLKCIDFKTGAVKWSETAIGSGALMAADGKLIVLSERGELIIAPASADGFKPVARAQVLGGKCWTVPVLANGKIYCRNAAGDLVCVDVSAKP